jgi:hypothetical protein
MCESSHTTEITIAITNYSTRRMVLYLEPWGEEFWMAPQEQIVIIGHGPCIGSGFGIEHIDEGVVITAWTGSVVRVFSRGQELGNAAQRPPVPDFD